MTIDLPVALIGCAAMLPLLALRLSRLAAETSDHELLPVRVRTRSEPDRRSR